MSKDKITDQEATIKALETELARRIVSAEHRQTPQNTRPYTPGLQGLPGAPLFNPFGASLYAPGHCVPWHPSVCASPATATATRDEKTPSPATPILIDDATDEDVPMRPADDPNKAP